MTNRIVITLDGGLVQAVENIPEGVEVELRDFDTDDTDRELLTSFGPGALAFVTTWKRPDDSTTDSGISPDEPGHFGTLGEWS